MPTSSRFYHFKILFRVAPEIVRLQLTLVWVVHIVHGRIISTVDSTLRCHITNICFLDTVRIMETEGNEKVVLSEKMEIDILAK